MDYDFEAFAQKRIANNKTTTSTASANQQASQSMSSVGARGLGSPSFSTNTSNQDDDDNDTGGVKSFMDTVFSWFNASGAPDPKMPPSYDGSSVYERDEFKPQPTRFDSMVDMPSYEDVDAKIDEMFSKKGQPYKGIYESTYDEIKPQEGVEDYKARTAMASGINTAIKGIMDTEQRQSTAMKDAINKTIQSVMSDSPDVPYVIQAGDTLSEIAVKTGTTVKELQKLNNIKKADEIYTGNELVIPSNKSTKTKEDIVSSLVGGMGGVSELGSSFEGDGVETAMSIVPSSVLSDAIESTTLENTLLNAIVGGESEDFDTVYAAAKIKPSKPITQMTVGEVMEWQKANIKAGSKSTAAGRFQIISPTLKGLVKNKTLKEDDIFDEVTQTKAYENLLDGRGYSKFKNKMKVAITETEKQKIAEDFLEELAKEFASIPVPKDMTIKRKGKTVKLKKGDSYYEGVAGNTTKHNPLSADDYLEILKQFNTDPTTLVPPARPAGLMDRYTIPRPQLRPENL